MLDPQLLRNNYKEIAERLKPRGFEFDIARFEELESQRRSIQSETETARNRRNTLSREIGKLKGAGQDTSKLMEEVTQVSNQLSSMEIAFSDVQQQMLDFSSEIPNIAHESVPLGQDEEDNLEVRRVGIEPKFNFEPKDHTTLGEQLGMIDFELAAKLSGSRFVVMNRNIAQMHRAIAQLMLDTHTTKHGYQEFNVPLIVNAEILYGTGQLPKFQDDQFHLDDSRDFYLIPTAEVPLTNIVKDTIVEPGSLPMKLVSHTPCFRREAGSYGKDSRGMIRQHQFEKVELVHIVEPSTSYDALEELTSNAETILKMLELPYRVIILCTGDMGFAAAKTYDIEVWLPGQQKYREISSCSNCEAFQARRMSARWRNPDTKRPEPLHTLNGSGLAVGRMLIAVMENYQQEDGSIVIPKALRPYMHGLECITKD